MTKRSPESKRRRKALEASGCTMAQVQRLSRVSYRMVQYWYDAKKPSPKVSGAHAVLTGSRHDDPRESLMTDRVSNAHAEQRSS